MVLIRKSKFFFRCRASSGLRKHYFVHFGGNLLEEFSTANLVPLMLILKHVMWELVNANENPWKVKFLHPIPEINLKIRKNAKNGWRESVTLERQFLQIG